MQFWEAGGETVMTTLCCFAEVCYLAVNHSLAGMVAYANDQGSPQVGVSMLGVSTTPVHPKDCLLCRVVMLFGWTQLCSSCFPFCTPKWVWDSIPSANCNGNLSLK